jgi:hypothetical protein
VAVARKSSGLGAGDGWFFAHELAADMLVELGQAVVDAAGSGLRGDKPGKHVEQLDEELGIRGGTAGGQGGDAGADEGDLVLELGGDGRAG